jgi:hypothetical protein
MPIGPESNRYLGSAAAPLNIALPERANLSTSTSRKTKKREGSSRMH